jgi:hypothetical protein
MRASNAMPATAITGNAAGDALALLAADGAFALTNRP